MLANSGYADYADAAGNTRYPTHDQQQKQIYIHRNECTQKSKKESKTERKKERSKERKEIKTEEI